MADQQSGWYPDPSGDATKLRYWDGTQWTNDFTDAPQAAQAVAPAEEVSNEAIAPEVATEAPAAVEAAAEQVQETPAAVEAVAEQVQEVPVETVASADPLIQPDSAAPATAEPFQQAAPVQTESFPEPAPTEPVQQYAQPQPAAESFQQPAEPAQPYAQPQSAENFSQAAPGEPMTASQPIPVQSADATAPQMQSQAPGAAPGSVPYQGQAQPAQPFAPAPNGMQGGMPGQPQPLSYQGAAPVKKKSKAPLIIGIVAAVVVIVAIVGALFIFGPLGNNSGGGGGAAIELDGDMTGTVGQTYETKWFTVTIDSMTTSDTYGDYVAAEGYTLLIAHITETNIFGSEQPFGTFDWFVSEGMSAYDGYSPLDPFTDDMMPTSFYLQDGETGSYDVVIEYPIDLTEPHLVYVEIDTEGSSYNALMYPVN